MTVATTTRPKTFTCRTTSEWLGHRGLRFTAGDEKQPLLVTNPPEIDGKPGEWTPEDFLVGAIETCLALTFARYSEKHHLPVEAYYSEAEGLFELEDGAYRVTRVIVKPTIVIESRDFAAKTLRVLEAAHRDCLIANAVTTSVIVEPSVILSACE